MSQYYFAVASLPMLSYEEAPPISGERFISFCRDQLSAKDFRALMAARTKPSRGSQPVAPAAEDSVPVSAASSTTDDGVDTDGVEAVEKSSAAKPTELTKKWRSWEHSLRYELARLRGQALGWETEVDIEAPFYPDTIETARSAINQETPLAGEELLARARFAFLDNLAAGHYFDLDSLTVYLLKLEILERRARFQMQAGTEAFNRAYEHISAGQIEHESELDNDQG